MISKNSAKRIIDRAIAHAGKRVDGIEVTVWGSNIATSRFALNSMTQNQAPDTVAVSVRVLVDGRQARLGTDNISAQAVRTVVDNAIAVAKLLEKDEELLPLPDLKEPGAYGSVDRFDGKTARMTAKARAARIKLTTNAAIEKNLRASGVFASGSWFIATGNSQGVFAFHQESSAECSVTIEKENSSGWAKAHAVDARAIDTQALVQSAIAAAEKTADPDEVPPGLYTVILSPSAVLDLVSFLWGDFSATSHRDKLSSLTDKVGQKVFGENITIKDDFAHPLQAGASFDGEGMPRTAVTLVEKGVVKNLVYGRRAAKHFGVESTGHGLTEPSSAGEQPANLVLEGRTTSREEMIASTDRGILLTRVWYVRVVDPSKLLLTGMTRDGTYLIENGKLVKGVRNLRFNVSVIELLNNVLALGPAVRAAGEEGFPAVVPAMKVANFNFTSTTKF
jgi:predicted Zn-dependent protease